jgi:hypothetical protein
MCPFRAKWPPLQAKCLGLRRLVCAWHRTCPRLSYYRRSEWPIGSVASEAGTTPLQAGLERKRSVMTILDLIKATVVCGAIAFLIYSYPILGQIVLIGFLSLLWLVYAHRTIANLRRR